MPRTCRARMLWLLVPFAACDSSSGQLCGDQQCPAGQHCVGNACVPWDAGAGADRSQGVDVPASDARLDSSAGDRRGDAPVDFKPTDSRLTSDARRDGSGLDLPQSSDLPPLFDLPGHDTCAAPCGLACCGAGQTCLAGAYCVTPVGPCQTGEDCFNDSYCLSGQCVPFGSGPGGVFNPSCLRAIPVGLFTPSLQCEWNGPPTGDPYPNHVNVLGTPMVVDFGNQAEGSPASIVFVSYDRLDGGGEAARCDAGAFGVIRIIRGSDCQQVATVENVLVRASSPLAVADLDGDQRAEIVAYACGGGVVAVHWDVVQKRFVQRWRSNPATLGNTEQLWSGPSVHDLDDDGKPEVLMGGIVFSNTGQLLDSTLGTLTPVGHPGGFAVVADLDGDGKVELVNGAMVWEWNSATKKWVVQTTSASSTGLVAIADFGTYGTDPTKDDRSKLDGIAEIAVVRSGSVVVQTVGGRVVFGPVSLPGGGAGGPPTIGDFDADGRVELACAGMASYTIFDPDCKAGAIAATCATLATTGILWTKTSQDKSSSSTGSSIFDFDGDGAAEAIYSDECFTRVYEGKTGEVLFSQYHTSCTWYENPVVADTDRDFQSELVVPSNTNCSKFAECTANYAKAPSGRAMDPLFKGLRCKGAGDCPSGVCNAGFCRCTTNAQCGVGSYECAAAVTGTPGSGNVCRSVIVMAVSGIRVYRDIQDRWVDSRPIWNQHAYSVTNVDENGVIPRTSAWAKNWTLPGMNNFRQNRQGALNPTIVPDLTSNLAQGVTCGSGNMTVQAQVCDRGTKSVGIGISAAVYVGDPKSGGKLGCVATTKKILVPGLCETVSCSITPSPTGKVDLYVVADDTGKGGESYVECLEKNNWAVLKGVGCP